MRKGIPSNLSHDLLKLAKMTEDALNTEEIGGTLPQVARDALTKTVPLLACRANKIAGALTGHCDRWNRAERVWKPADMAQKPELQHFRFLRPHYCSLNLIERMKSFILLKGVRSWIVLLVPWQVAKWELGNRRLPASTIPF